MGDADYRVADAIASGHSDHSNGRSSAAGPLGDAAYVAASLISDARPVDLGGPSRQRGTVGATCRGSRPSSNFTSSGVIFSGNATPAYNELVHEDANSG